MGNITSKSDYGNLYLYGAQPKTPEGAGPHAVLMVSQGGHFVSFNYDENGNMVSGDGRTISFDKLDRPETIVMGGVTTRFRYAPDGARYLQRTTGASSPNKTVYYVDKDYERIDWGSSGPIEERSYLGESAVVSHTPDGRSVTYRHLDRLGSPDAMTNANRYEVIPEAHGFDAFGKPRGRDWQPNGDKLHPVGDFGMVTERGFTKHEHLDDTYLIHMNGRVYDYRLGRFLSVDPIISNPANSQSINPYSYIGNNPLSGVDPTGYCPNGVGGNEPATTGTHICGVSDQSVPNLTVSGTRSVTSRLADITAAVHRFISGTSGQGAAADAATPAAANGSPKDVSKNTAEFMKGFVGVKAAEQGKLGWYALGALATHYVWENRESISDALRNGFEAYSQAIKAEAQSAPIITFPVQQNEIVNADQAENAREPTPQPAAGGAGQPGGPGSGGGGEDVESKGIVAQNGTKVTGFMVHGIDRAIGDAAQRAGTRPQAILNALKNPLKIVSGVDQLGRPFQVFTGQDARVVVNPKTGQVVSVNPMSGAGAH